MRSFCSASNLFQTNRSLPKNCGNISCCSGLMSVSRNL
jgi:hypothetical protein